MNDIDMKIKIVERKVDPSGFGNNFVSRYKVYRSVLGLFWKEMRFPYYMEGDRDYTHQITDGWYFYYIVRGYIFKKLQFRSKEEAISAVRYCYGCYASGLFNLRALFIESSEYEGFTMMPCLYRHSGELKFDAWICFRKECDLIINGSLEYCKVEMDKWIKKRDGREYVMKYRKEEIVEV